MKPSADFRDFVIWEREASDTIDFKKIYVDMAGDLKAGLMLSQMVYWRLPRKNRSEEDSRLTIERDGRKWLAKSDKDWWGEIRLTDKEARSARMVLEQRGLVEFKVWKFAGVPTVHSSINEDRFMALWSLMLDTPLEERQAGRIEAKAKREKYRNPGTKPRSGNWRKNQPPEAPAAAEAGEDGDGPAEGAPARNYEKGNLEIAKSVISELPKGQNGNYPEGNMQIAERANSYTETPAEIPPESPSEIPPENPFIHPKGGSEEPTPGMDEREGSGETHEGTPGQAAPEGGEDLPLTGNGGAQVKGTKLNRAADTEDLPAAAAAAPTGGSAILALQPIPMAELLARPERDPFGQRERNKVLRALMSATAASRDDHLRTQLGVITPSGLSRQLCRRLTDQELELARDAAQQDKGLVKGGFPSASYYALERLIGEPVPLARLTGTEPERRDETPLGRAYQVTGAGAAVQSAPPQPDADEPVNGDFQPGALWKQKKGPDTVRIEDRTPTGLKLDNGKTISMLDLSRLYQLVTPAPARVAS